MQLVATYDRVFAADTPATNEKARRVMVGVYALLLLAGAAFLVYASVSRGPTAPVIYVLPQCARGTTAVP